MRRLWMFSLPWLAGCTLAAPLRAPAPALTDSSVGQVSVAVRWPAQRATQALPGSAARVRLYVRNRDGVEVASVSLEPQFGQVSSTASFLLTPGSGYQAEGWVDASDTVGVASASSDPFAVRRNQATAVPLSVASIVRTMVGTGARGFSPDGTLAASVSLSDVSFLALDTQGHPFYVECQNDLVRTLGPDGTIRTVLGVLGPNGGVAATSFADGEGGPATQAPTYGPVGLACGTQGDLFVTDNNPDFGARYQARVRWIPASDHPRFGMTPVAGHVYTLLEMSSIDGGQGLVEDHDGSLLVTEASSGSIRRIAPDGTASTLLGNPDGTESDGVAASNLKLPDGAWALALDGGGNLAFSDDWGGKLRLSWRDANGRAFGGDRKTGMVYVLATAGANGVPEGAHFRGVAFDPAGSLLAVEAKTNTVWRFNRETGVGSAILGGGGATMFAPRVGDGGSPLSATLWFPSAIAVDGRGRLWVGDSLDYRIRAVDF